MATPPPIKLKQSQTNATAHTLTAVSSSFASHDTARLLIRKTLHISANLASSPSIPARAGGGRVCEFELEADLL